MSQNSLRKPLPAAAEQSILLPTFSTRSLEEPHRDPIIVPIRDDHFAPILCAGDLAVVDTRVHHIELGAIVWLRYRSGSTQFARIKGVWNPTGVGGKPLDDHYRVDYGAARIFDLNGKPCEAGLRSGDSIPKAYLSEIIVGHVVGRLSR